MKIDGRIGWVLALSLAVGCGGVENSGDGDGDGDGDGGVDGPTLTVTVDGDGTGAVTSNPAGIDCPGTCSASFAAGTEVTLSPAPGAASSFDGWSGDCAGIGACAVTLDVDRAVTASFQPSGAVREATQFGSAGLDEPRRMVVDSAGNVIIGGIFTEDLTFGGDTFNSTLDPNNAPSRDVFVVKLGPDGSHIWSIAFGSPGLDDLFGLEVDKDDNVIIAGDYAGAMKIGDKSLPFQASTETYVAKLGGANGNPLWAKGFTGSSTVRTNDIAVDSAGNVIVTFYFKGTTNFGDGNVTTTGGDDIAIGKYSATNGSKIWTKTFGADSGKDEQITGVGVDANDNVLVYGYFFGTLNLGGVNDLAQSGTDRDLFIARFDGGGNHDWSTAYASTVGIFTNFGTVDADGNFIAGGRFSGTANFGGDDFTSDVGTDLYVAKFSGENGSHVWSEHFASDGFKTTTGLALLANGDVVATGHFELDTDFDGTVLSNAARRNWWTARLDAASGAVRWVQSFGDSQGAGGTVGRAVAVGPGNALYATGDFNDTVTFGAGNEFTSSTAAIGDIALVRLYP